MLPRSASRRSSSTAADDRDVNVERGSLHRGADPGREIRRAAGDDHLHLGGDDVDAVARRDRGVPHRDAAQRRSPTASWRPSCSPTSSARPSARPSSATGAGASCVDAHDARGPARARAVPRARDRHRGRRLPRDASTGRPGAIRCARVRSAKACAALGIEIRAGLHTGECELMRRQDRRDRRPHRERGWQRWPAPGEVLVSSTVTRPGRRLRDLASTIAASTSSRAWERGASTPSKASSGGTLSPHGDSGRPVRP